MEKSKQPLLWLGASSLLAALLALVFPLARNFEYEYLTLTAYLSLGLYALASLLVSTHWSIKGLSVFLALLAGLVLPAIPGAFAFASGLCPCSQQDFWFWYGVQLLPHLVLGQALFLGVYTLRQKNFSRLFCCSLLALSGLLLFLHLAGVLWIYPQKRITHLLSGFVHGAIYDNWIPLDAGVLWARAAHACFASTILFSLAVRANVLRWSLTLLSFGSFLGFSIKAQTYPSQWHGLDRLIQLMPESQEGPNFILHYQKPANEAEKKLIQNTYISTGFHVGHLNKQLMSYQRTIHIFIYPSHESKKLWFGGESTDITDVRTPSIHITAEPWPHSTLRHEIVHALSSGFAYHGLGFHPNLAFTEGIAVALAPSDEEISLHEGAARILQSDRIPDLDHLFSPLFWSASGRRAYTVAGSLLKFLIDRYGIPQVKLLYSGTEWSHIFAEDFENTLKLWRNFLEVSYPPHQKAMGAEALYRYAGLLSDSCPHSKATLLQTGDDSYLAWRRPQAWKGEVDYWQWREQFDQDPRTQLGRTRRELDKLWQNFSLSAGQEQLLSLQTKIPEHPSYQEDIEYKLIELDLLVSLERHEEALRKSEELKHLLSSHQLSDGLVRQIWARFLLLQAPQNEARPWLNLLSGRSKDVPDTIAPEASWIVRYLYLRNHSFTADDRPFLIAAFDQPFPPELPPSFAVEWFKYIGLQWIRQDRWKWGSQALLKASEFAPEGKKEYLKLLSEEAFARDPRVH